MYHSRTIALKARMPQPRQHPPVPPRSGHVRQTYPFSLVVGSCPCSNIHNCFHSLHGTGSRVKEIVIPRRTHPGTVYQPPFTAPIQSPPAAPLLPTHGSNFFIKCLVLPNDVPDFEMFHHPRSRPLTKRPSFIRGGRQ